MQEILLKYTDKYAEFIIPWLLTSGLKIVFIIIGSLILNKVIITFIDKAVRIAVRPDGISSKDAEEKRTIAGLMVLQEFGVEIAPILAAAGIVGLAFGFGGQYLIRDIISGLFIILENQYRVGDIVKFDNAGGTVEEISLRKTTLRDLDGTVHHIPHGEIKKVSNLSKDFSRINLDIGVGYGSNLEHVIGVINSVGTALATDPLWENYIILSPQFLRVNDFADSSIMLKILGETLPSKQWEVTGELRKRLKIAFDNEGIEIPFPQVVVHRPIGIEEATVKKDINEIQKQ